MSISYDVFISYNRRHSAVVEVLARRLAQEAGLRIWLDRARLTAGESWRSEIEAALNSSAAALIAWGPGGLGAVQLQERDLAYVIRDARRDFRLIHVFLPAAEPPRGSWANVDTWVRFEGGGDEDESFAALVAALKGEATHQELSAELPDYPAPYRGLAPFEAGDARFFFGRSGDAARLLERLDHHPFLAVVGPSGCGKTSLVQAGLLPQLDDQRRSDEGKWTRVLLRPGGHPLTTLAAALARAQPAGERLESLERSSAILTRDPASIGILLDTLLDPARPVVLVVDRLEELFGLCSEPSERAAFATALLAAAGRARVVVTMRADFYGELAALGDFADTVVKQQVYLKPLPADSVTEAIAAPAAEVGAVFEKGLATQLRIDAQGSGELALPFLQHTLELLWRRRRGRWLTWDAYREIGGVSGALRYHADGLIESLTPVERKIARRLLTALVHLGGTGGTVIAQAMPKADLVGSFPDPALAEPVLQRLADARLVVIRDDGGVATADIAHDTLPLHWDRLRAWINADRTFLRWRERLRLAESEWRRLDMDPGSLLHGSALHEAERWLDERLGEFGPSERRFIEKSLVESARERRAQERRRHRVLAAVSGALVLTAVLAGLLAWQWRLAEEQTRAAMARQWTTEASLLAEAEPHRIALSALLAAESMRTAPTRQAYRVLYEKVGIMPRPIVTGLGHPAGINGLRFDPTGRLLLSASSDGSTGVWDWRASKAVHRLAHGDQVNLAVFSPDGTLIATAGNDDTAAIWSATSGERLHKLAHDDDVLDLAFSPDGRLLATASHDKSARLWSVPGGNLVRAFPMDRLVTSVAFSGDGRYLAIGAGDPIEVWAYNKSWQQLKGRLADRDRLERKRPGGVLVWDLENRREVMRTRQGLGVNAVAFSAESQMLAAAGFDRTARTWNLLTGEAIAEVSHEDIAQKVAFSPDGRYVASISASVIAQTSASYSAKAWDPRTGKELARFTFRGPLLDLAVSPTGRTFVTGGADGTARVIEPLRQREITRIGLPPSVTAVAFAPDAKHVAVASGKGALGVWEIPSAAADFGLALNWWSSEVMLSPDGSYLVGKRSADTLQVWPVGAAEPRAELKHADNVLNPIIAPGGRFIATSSYGGLATLWDAENGVEIARETLGDQGTGIKLATPVPDGRRWAVTGEAAGQLRILQAPAGGELATIRHEGGIRAALFSPDGRFLATVGVDDTVRLWDAGNGRERLRLVTGTVWPSGLAFSPSGEILVVASRDRIRVYAVEDGRLLDQIPDFTFASVAVSHDDRYLAIASGRDLVLWDRTQGQAMGRIPHGASVNQVTFSPDDRQLITAAGESFSSQHTVQRWLWRPDDLLSEACARAARNLTQAEWVRYGHDLPYRRTCPELPIDIADATGYAASLVQKGDAKGARAAYRRAVHWVIEGGEAAACNWVCAYGALDGYAREVLPACACAVDGATDAERAEYRDSRGLARALSGDHEGAIEDWNAFVKAMAEVTDMAASVKRRESWIEALSAGRDPFDEATLQVIRNE